MGFVHAVAGAGEAEKTLCKTRGLSMSEHRRLE